MLLNEMLWKNRRLGRRTERVSLVRLGRKRFDVDELPDIYNVNMKTVKAILDTIDAHPDWDDEKVAENVDFD